MSAPVAQVDSCPVCGAPAGRVLYAQAQDPITLDCFRVAECTTCGIAYTAPRPASLDDYYPTRYRSYGPLVTGILGALYNARVRRWAGLKRDGGSVLEIGCGPGLMLAAFARYGWKALGIERNEKAAQRARHIGDVEITTAPVEALPAEAKFDLIVMFHVLEHMVDPVALLSECARRLKPGGRFIANVPNFASWQSRFAGPKWLHLDAPRHLVHFTPQTLAATLDRAGLKLTGVAFTSIEHDPFGWVESTASHLTGRTNTLTRFLMGLDPFGPAVLFSLFLAAALVVPSLLLASASWLAGRGAVMEVTAVALATEPRHGIS